MPRSKHLFSNGDLSTWLERRMAEAREAAASIEPDAVLATPEANLVNELFDRYRADPPHLRLDERYAEPPQDVQIDVSQGPRRVVSGRSRPVYVAGTRLVVHVPFDGDPELFHLMPSTRSSVLPSGEVRGEELLVSDELPADDPRVENLPNRLEQRLEEIERWLAWVAADCARFNERLRDEMRAAVLARKQKVLRDRKIEAALRIPVRRRPDASPVLRVDVPRRRRPIKALPSGGPVTPFQPEPAPVGARHRPGGLRGDPGRDQGLRQRRGALPRHVRPDAGGGPP